MRTLNKFMILAQVLAVAGIAGSCSINQKMGKAVPSVDTPDAIRLSQSRADGFYWMGRYYQGQSRYNEAADTYRACLKQAPDHIEARNGLGVSLAMLGRYDEAVVVFGEVVERSPDSGRFWHNLGYAHYLAGNWKLATESLQKAAFLNPTNVKAYHYLSLAQAKLEGHPVVRDQIFEEAGSRPSEVVTKGAVQPENIGNNLPRGINAEADQAALISIAPQVYEMRVVKDGNESLGMKDSKVMAPQASPVIAQGSIREPSSSSRHLQVTGLEVSNGNGINGMGRRVVGFLNNEGVKATRLTNQPSYNVRQTELQFRNGYREQAEQVASVLPRSVVLRVASQLRADINVRLVLGRDIARVVTWPDAFLVTENVAEVLQDSKAGG